MLEHTARRDTVLVVDDTPETLGFLTDTLDHAGYTVLIATDGDSAIELVDQITPDIILMDAMMPGISGFEACRRLKRDKLLANLPVIFMTGLSETEHVVEGLAAGGVDYVTKPIIVDELLARIRVHLTNARMASDTHAALDALGRFLLAIDQHGKLLWCTPKAKHLLDELFMTDTTAAPTLPPHIAAQLMGRENGSNNAPVQIDVQQRKLEFSLVSSIGPDEYLFRIAEIHTGNDVERLQKQLALTSREAEILAWISRGKTNRDIGEILNISPRTVNKHLEQVFIKLGVENRAAATARAMKALAR
ncbi:MAG TPA: response regulator transcription factor [Steroidobacteraceae bacterium]|nr:response regulator transcription factor [Steroidobacteraceae bacterium]